MRKLSIVLFFGAVATQVGATDCGQALRDPGYDLWCGEDLCAWKLERGEIERVATWHEGDSGVELVGPDTAIAQLSPLDSGDGQCRDNADGSTSCTYPDDVCLEFSLLANIDENAVVDLNLDVFNDGTIDHTQRLPIAKWQPLAYKVVIRMPFAGVRFQLAKSGSGVAQLANIGAELARNCDGLPVIDPRPAPLGSPCETAGDCASGICGLGATPTPFSGVNGFLQPNTVCLGCDSEHPCTAGEVCGIGDAVTPVRAEPTTCVPVAAKPLGNKCLLDTECASSVCTEGMCSTCTTSADCANGGTCGKAWTSTYSPWVCNPGAGARQSGEPCASHADCASSVCVGAELGQCNDGRACTSPAQCPFEDGLESGACTTVGIEGGTCQ